MSALFPEGSAGIGASNGFGTEGEGRGGGEIPRPSAAGTRPEGETRQTPEEVIAAAKSAAAQAPGVAPKKRGRPPGSGKKPDGSAGAPKKPDGVAIPMTPEEEAKAKGEAPPPPIDWDPKICGDIMRAPFKVYAWVAVPEPARKAYALSDEMALELGKKLKPILEKYQVADRFAHEISLGITLAVTFYACNIMEAAILDALTKEELAKRKAAGQTDGAAPAASAGETAK